MLRDFCLNIFGVLEISFFLINTFWFQMILTQFLHVTPEAKQKSGLSRLLLYEYKKNRIETFSQYMCIFHPGKTGLITGRHSSSNTCRLCNSINITNEKTQETVITSLDVSGHHQWDHTVSQDLHTMYRLSIFFTIFSEPLNSAIR